MEKEETRFERLTREKASVEYWLKDDLKWVTDIKDYLIIVDKEIELEKP